MLANKGLEVVQNANGAVVIRRAANRPQANAGAETTGEDIIVTGSRIERAGFDTLQPAMVADAKELERRGYVNAAPALGAPPLFGASDSSDVELGRAQRRESGCPDVRTSVCALTRKKQTHKPS